jgi:Na+/H+-translocating membrane pyrophosphatase
MFVRMKTWIERIWAFMKKKWSNLLMLGGCHGGDPFKDIVGPSLHVLIKLLATITLVMIPLILDT